MFGKFKSFVDKAEKATGVDLDGDGKSGGKKASKAKGSKAKTRAAPAVNALDALEKVTGKDLDGDGDVAGQKAAASRDATSVKLDDGTDVLTSKCDGNKKSVFIGCNYPGSKAELGGW